MGYPTYDDTVADTQREVKLWTDHNFPGESLLSVTLGLAEEVGEVCRAVLKQHQGIRGTHEEWQEEIQKELGDVFIKLCHVATTAGIDFRGAITVRWADVRKRDWIADKTGHGINV
jgi:NTP pyrophosphatase (non-canonical NTP hydrolase)